MRARLYRVSLLAVVGALVALSSILTFPTPARAGGTFSPGAGIDATGSTDVTAALQGFLDGVPDGSTVSFGATARYRIEGTLRLVGRQNLTLVGNGATFFATTIGNRTRSQWQVEGGANIVFRSMVIKGANPRGGVEEEAYVSALEAQHAINAGNVRGLEIDRVTATDTYGDFVYLGKQFGGWVDGAFIHDSRFERNGRQGISITGARNVRITNNYIGDTRRATFDIEPNGAAWGADNVLIADNVVGPGRLLFIASAGSGPVSNVTVTRNVLHRPLRVTVGSSDGTRRQNFVVTDNISDVNWGRAGGSALTFKKVDGVTVTGNVQKLQSGRGTVGVEAFDSCNVTVRGNSFPGGAGEATIAAYAGCGASGTTGPTASPSPSASAKPTATATASPKPSATATASAKPSASASAPAKPSATTSATPGPNAVASPPLPGRSAVGPDDDADQPENGPMGDVGDLDADGNPFGAGAAGTPALGSASSAGGAVSSAGSIATNAVAKAGARSAVAAELVVGLADEADETSAADGGAGVRAGVIPGLDTTTVPGALGTAGAGLGVVGGAVWAARAVRLRTR